MTAVVFDGEVEARQIEIALQSRVKALCQKGIVPRLVSFYFKEDPASRLYTRLKAEAADRVGIKFERVECSFKDEVKKIQEKIYQLGKQENVTGIMVQKPAKRIWQSTIYNLQTTNFSEWWEKLTGAIDPEKDVDCLTRENLEKVYHGTGKMMPATVRAVLAILARVAQGLRLKADYDDVKKFINGKNIVVIGRSEIVGRPLAAVLQQRGARVDLLSPRQENLGDYTRAADIVVACAGMPRLIKADMVKDGVVVIDVGSPGGDVDFARVKAKASFITPVPEGVGPMTVVSLLKNLVELIAVDLEFRG